MKCYMRDKFACDSSIAINIPITQVRSPTTPKAFCSDSVHTMVIMTTWKATCKYPDYAMRTPKGQNASSAVITLCDLHDCTRTVKSWTCHYAGPSPVYSGKTWHGEQKWATGCKVTAVQRTFDLIKQHTSTQSQISSPLCLINTEEPTSANQK